MSVLSEYITPQLPTISLLPVNPTFSTLLPHSPHVRLVYLYNCVNSCFGVVRKPVMLIQVDAYVPPMLCNSKYMRVLFKYHTQQHPYLLLHLRPTFLLLPCKPYQADLIVVQRHVNRPSIGLNKWYFEFELCEYLKNCVFILSHVNTS